MNSSHSGLLWQMISLVSAVHGSKAGNRYLTKAIMKHKCFSYCNVSFPKASGHAGEVSGQSQDLGEWLASVANDGVIGAWLVHSSTAEPIAPDHQLVAFAGGGGTWRMVLSFPDRTEIWVSKWQFKKPGLFVNRSGSYNVTYHCLARYDTYEPPPSFDLSQAEIQLWDVLARSRDFEIKHNQDASADYFDRGYKALQTHRYLQNSVIEALVYPDCFPENAKRLLSTASEAWVLCQMGSWNGLGHESASEHEEYDPLSSELYSSIMQAVQQACCSFSINAKV